MDKATCEADTDGNVSLGDNTKSNYYLGIDDTNKFMLSSILAAYAKGDVVSFRMVAAENGYNKIAYIVTPAKANQQ